MPGMSLQRPSPRMVADTIVGYALVAAGLVMLVTPGPGVLAIVAGLAVLARHYRWAERLRRATVARIRDTSLRVRAHHTSTRLATEARSAGSGCADPADRPPAHTEAA